MSLRFNTSDLWFKGKTRLSTFDEHFVSKNRSKQITTEERNVKSILRAIRGYCLQMISHLSLLRMKNLRHSIGVNRQ